MTESILLVLVITAIGAAAFFAYRAAKAQEAAMVAKARFEGVDMIRQERDRAVAEVEKLRGENSKLNADLASERGAAQARAQAAEEQQKALKEHFAALAAQALDANQQRFLSLANETFEKHKTATTGGMKEIVGPVQEQFVKLSETIAALDKARTEDKSALHEQMRQIGETLAKTRDETGKLIGVLRAAPKARGRWGEESLRNVLELSGLSAHVDYVEQTSHENDEKRAIRPDVILRLPGERCIVIDAKVALSGYLDAMDATDDATRETFLKKHAQELRTHMKQLASKEYWKHVPTSADFVVLFVGGENFFSAAIERDPTLIEDSFANGVVIVTPVTMFALAKAVAYGWRQEESAKNAQEIAELGRELYRRLATMSDRLSSVGDAIGKSVKSYNDLVGSMESRVLPQARKFKELGAGESNAEISPQNQIDTTPRTLAPPEQLELMPPPQPKKRGAG